MVVFFHNDWADPTNLRIWHGEAYTNYLSGNGDAWAFRSKTKSVEVSSKDDAECWFDFIFCWRGVWDGRVYPRKSEFWGEELADMAAIWAKIEKILKERIKQDNPDYEHFDD